MNVYYFKEVYMVWYCEVLRKDIEEVWLCILHLFFLS